ncbi:PREDICTED: uncharacterized protein LOC108617466 [Drosophila arizonae]|uniref:Uncharacterized protein LOC108617466 n=1 Tax=Drosophila arizonae TaxID=7263 RepID=A0ABM1PNH3_DROAR|nr:PREDICTED: uncharacterized protein LOC108617466 [Drosophila arizonae]
MSQPIKKSVSEPNIEEAFQRHSPIAVKVKGEYEKALIDLFADMGPICLEPFAAILLEHENTILNKDTLIERVRMRMSQLLPKINENFFISNDVGKKLITLEVLKEKFEPYKGTNWQVHKLTPEERTRPVRMRLMDSSIRFIQKQINAQEKAIEIALAKSKENRERIQNIQNERVKLYALMQQQMGYYEEMEPKLMDLIKIMIGNVD